MRVKFSFFIQSIGGQVYTFDKGGSLIHMDDMEKYIQEAEVNRDIPSIRSLKRMMSMAETAKVIENESGIEDKALLKKLVIYMSHRVGGMYSKDIGAYYGVSESAVSQASLRFERDRM